MTISITALGANRSGEGITSFAMSSFTLPADRLGIIFVIQAGGGPPSNVPTISGWYTKPAWTYEHSDIRRVTMFTRKSATDVTEGPTIDFGGQTQSRVTYNVMHCNEDCSIAGTQGEDAIVQFLASADIHSPSINATPTLDPLSAFSHVNNAALSLISIAFNADSASVGSGFTHINSAGVTGFSDMGSVAQYKSTNEINHALTGCTNSQDMFIGAAVELAHVAVGPPPPPPPPSQYMASDIYL